MSTTRTRRDKFVHSCPRPESNAANPRKGVQRKAVASYSIGASHISAGEHLAARLFAAGVAGFGVALAALGAFVFAAGLAGGDAGAG